MNAEKRYVERLLDLYQRLPGTRGHLLSDDRRTARALHLRGIRLELIQQAFLLALARRSGGQDTARLEPIRSLRYFLPVIQEILDSPPDPGYLLYLESRLRRAGLRPPS